ncbi:MAG: Uma2 family endonuclease [Isosphaeraceae bacterium]
MATDVKTKLLTAEEFMAADLGEGTFELVRGEVIQLPPSMPEHGLICVNIGVALWNYGKRTGHGYPISNDSAVVTERGPDTVRGADISYYRQDHWPRSEVGWTLPPVQPDLVVEVYSPGNRRGKILEKLAEYLGAGIPLVWIVYPKSRTVTMYRSLDEPPDVLKQDAVIENLPELPGFRCPVADFFL